MNTRQEAKGKDTEKREINNTEIMRQNSIGLCDRLTKQVLKAFCEGSSKE